MAGYSYFDLDGALFRRHDNSVTRSVDDILVGNEWRPYQGADKLRPALFGREIGNPLAGFEEQEHRAAILRALNALNALGINQGTSGNISVRLGDDMLISPSAMPYEDMRPEDIVRVRLRDGAWEGGRAPSTEFPFHRAIQRARAEAGAVVHAHPPHCTALAMARRPIPPCHYMVGVFGGDDVRCADYATFGTEELAMAALEALTDRCACLLANHGIVVFAPTLARAMWLAVELEAVARQYVLSQALGGPVLLSEAEMAESRARLAGYGLQA